jgi:hypothetical protein
MLTKEECVQKYLELKQKKNGGVPKRDEFLDFSDLDGRHLEKLFGSNPYSKLQSAAGDNPNKLEMERTPFEVIMRQFGNLVAEVGSVPPYAEWRFRGLKPTDAGLRLIHNLKWSEMPTNFVEWVSKNKIAGYDKVVEIITASNKNVPAEPENTDVPFDRLIKDVRGWVPARRRNSEGEYKIELRKHLESLKYELNEEFGESKYDLLVNGCYAIEIKKDPELADYDRLFGQLARHLQHQCKAIVLILEATRKDKFDNFVELVDRYLNVESNSIEIIGR